MRFDQYPESIVKPNGDLVIPQSRLVTIISGAMICFMAILGTVQAVIAWGTWFEPLAIGLPCLLIGIVISLLTYEVHVDQVKGQVLYRWKIGSHKIDWGVRRLNEFTGVVFGHYLVRSEGRSYRVNFVGLQEADQERWYELVSVKNESDGRRYGKVIAKALELPLYRKDSLALPRRPSELDLKLHERVKREEIPSPPPSMRTTLERQQDQLTLHIPGPGLTDPTLKAQRWFTIGAISLCSAFMAIGMLSVQGVETWIVWTMLALVVPFDMVLYLFIFSPMLKRQANQNAQLTLTSEQLTIRELDANGVESTAEFRLRDLEEFFHDVQNATKKTAEPRSFFSKGTVLLASSDDASKSFGAWLPNAEKDYIVALVHQLIAQIHQQQESVADSEASASRLSDPAPATFSSQR